MPDDRPSPRWKAESRETVSHPGKGGTVTTAGRAGPGRPGVPGPGSRSRSRRKSPAPGTSFGGRGMPRPREPHPEGKRRTEVGASGSPRSAAGGTSGAVLRRPDRRATGHPPGDSESLRWWKETPFDEPLETRFRRRRPAQGTQPPGIGVGPVFDVRRSRSRPGKRIEEPGSPPERAAFPGPDRQAARRPAGGFGVSATVEGTRLEESHISRTGRSPASASLGRETPAARTEAWGTLRLHRQRNPERREWSGLRRRPRNDGRSRNSEPAGRRPAVGAPEGNRRTNAEGPASPGVSPATRTARALPCPDQCTTGRRLTIRGAGDDRRDSRCEEPRFSRPGRSPGLGVGRSGDAGGAGPGRGTIRPRSRQNRRQWRSGLRRRPRNDRRSRRPGPTGRRPASGAPPGAARSRRRRCSRRRCTRGGNG